MALSSLFVKSGILSSSEILVENPTCTMNNMKLLRLKKGIGTSSPAYQVSPQEGNLRLSANHSLKTIALVHHKEICSSFDIKQVQSVPTLLLKMAVMGRPCPMPGRCTAGGLQSSSQTHGPFFILCTL